MSIYIMHELGILLDEEFEANSFMGIFKSWFHLPASKVEDSRPALTAFIREFLAGDMTIFDNYQEARLFFASLAPNPQNRTEGVPLMGFMQPTSVETVSRDPCEGCGDAGYRRPGNFTTNEAFDIPLPDQRAENESLQSLVDMYFNVHRDGELISCSCKGQVNVITYTQILDPKRAVLIHIDRFLPTPERDIRGITGMLHTPQGKTNRGLNLFPSDMKIFLSLSVPSSFRKVIHFSCSSS